MLAALQSESAIVSKLLQAGTLSSRRLEEIRLEAELAGIPVVDALCFKDVVSDADTAQSFAETSGLRFLDLSRRSPHRAWTLMLPEFIARRYRCLIFGEVSGQLVAAVADPGDVAVKAELESRFHRSIQYVVSPAFQINAKLDELYGDARERGARHVSTPPLSTAIATNETTGLNMIEELDRILDEAVDRRASDIHVEPEADRLRIRYRIDGRLVEARAYPIDLSASMISRVKVLCNLDITERRRPQDGRFSHKSFEQQIDVRVAVIPTVRGERMTLRLLGQGAARVSLDRLGMGAEVKQAFERLIRRPHGIILITGPTGSGKSTTLHAALLTINSADRHIITIEDPVEYDIPSVNQVAVDHEFGVTFPAALRSILRHDPDIIMVGEIRDEETAGLAIEASLTGHLVFATLHTNSAVGAVTRLLEMGCEPYLVASAVIGVMAQRLVRKICENCRRPYEPNAEERRLLRIPAERTGATIFRGTGCSRCLRSGYYDRVGIFELVSFDSGLSELVMRKETADVLEKYAVAHGAITLKDDAIEKVRSGLTTLEEALRVTTID